MTEVSVKTPGKLYVAGEYAVVEPGYSAIITSVDSFIHLSMTESSENFGTIYSEGFIKEPVPFYRNKGSIELAHAQNTLKYVHSAIEITEKYIQSFGCSPKYYDIQIHSELINETGHKLGLGSSGAVTVATVLALLKFYAMDYTDLTVFKLSVLAQLELGINSSFGDLASIAYTGWIKYTSFDREAVFDYTQLHAVKETVDWDWPFLKIMPLNVPKAIHFLIGWTGKPASSDELVGAVQDKKNQSQKQYQHFLNVSQKAVDQLANALQVADFKQLAESIHLNRKALFDMGKQTNVLIETEQLTQLCDIAESHGGAAKTSGAGGGDSGIAFIFEEEKATAMIKDWQDAGIKNLPLRIFSK